MHEYTFDVSLVTSITVKAQTKEEAYKMMDEALECADVNFGSWPNGDPILGQACVEGQMDLMFIDGEDHYE